MCCAYVYRIAVMIIMLIRVITVSTFCLLVCQLLSLSRVCCPSTPPYLSYIIIATPTIIIVSIAIIIITRTVVIIQKCRNQSMEYYPKQQLYYVCISLAIDVSFYWSIFVILIMDLLKKQRNLAVYYYLSYSSSHNIGCCFLV